MRTLVTNRCVRTRDIQMISQRFSTTKNVRCLPLGCNCQASQVSLRLSETVRSPFHLINSTLTLNSFYLAGDLRKTICNRDSHSLLPSSQFFGDTQRDFSAFQINHRGAVKRINMLDFNDVFFDRDDFTSTHTNQIGAYRRMGGKDPR